jgi:hypothetical protein
MDICMNRVGQGVQLVFQVRVIGQAAFALPVVVPGGFGGQFAAL